MMILLMTLLTGWVNCNIYRNIKEYTMEKKTIKFLVESWNVVMDHETNPLRNIQNMAARHMIMQVLAWMWCIVFAIIVGSLWAGVISMALHALLLAAVFTTVAVFETAKRKPNLFGSYSGRSNNGEHE